VGTCSLKSEQTRGEGHCLLGCINSAYIYRHQTTAEDRVPEQFGSVCWCRYQSERVRQLHQPRHAPDAIIHLLCNATGKTAILVGTKYAYYAPWHSHRCTWRYRSYSCRSSSRRVHMCITVEKCATLRKSALNDQGELM